MPRWENPPTWRTNLAFLRPRQEQRPAAGWEEGALAAPSARGSQPFRAICLVLSPPTLNLFSSAQPVPSFLPHSEARALKALANDFPGDEIR